MSAAGSAPESAAVTPGQAAYEAWHPIDCDCGFSWANLGEHGRRTWEATGQRAIGAFLSGDSVSADVAARQPQPAPGERFSSLRPEQVAAIRAELDNPQPHAPFPMEDPQPAPGERPRFNWPQFTAAVTALRQIAGAGTLEDAHELAGEALEAVEDAGQPAPGLSGDTEPVMTPAVARPSFGSTLVLAIHPGQDDEAARKGEEAIRAATAGEGVTVVTVRGVEALRTWEPQPAPGPHYYTAGTGCADCRAEAKLAELSELLEEIGVLAANAPEDGDCFAVLEEIAMRVAAAGVTGAAS